MLRERYCNKKHSWCFWIIIHASCRHINNLDTYFPFFRYYTGSENHFIRVNKLQMVKTYVTFLILLLTFWPLTRPIFFIHPVVLELICCRTKAKRLINESNTTGIWSGNRFFWHFFKKNCQNLSQNMKITKNRLHIFGS